MSSARPAGEKSRTNLTLAQKAWRELCRPFRPRKTAQRRLVPPPAQEPLAPLSSAALPFDPQLSTVEPAGLALLRRLVREAADYPGPIIEIGTLAGITATHMALAKRPEQKIITVDNYCWNPWNWPADQHHAMARQVLHYLTETGHVELVRADKAQFYASYSGPPPALVFLDAWHTYEETKKDIDWARSVGARLIAGHDYCDQFPGVIQIVNERGGPREIAGWVWVLNSESQRACQAA